MKCNYDGLYRVYICIGKMGWIFRDEVIYNNDVNYVSIRKWILGFIGCNVKCMV